MGERLRVTFDADLRRRRLAVFLRALLAIPPMGVLAALSLLAAAIFVVAWPAAVLAGRVPAPAHRFLRVYIRYAVRVVAWTTLVSRRYPRVRGVVPPSVDVERTRQPRLSALVRLPLAVPSLVLASALGAVLLADAIAGWFVALVRGRTTEGLRELGSFCIRYQAETLAYVLLLSSRAPRLEPPTPAPR